jgi:hypothetical protein
MKYFSSHGGNNAPYFAHRIKVTDGLRVGAFEWCEAYPDGDHPFRRFHVEWDHYSEGQEGHKGFVTIQFEWEEAAIMFALMWV